jgi:hypothetical protein
MHSLLRPSVLALVALSLACGGPSPQDRELVQATDALLEFPESVVWDKANDAWYVSNFGGTRFADDSGKAPSKADENGFITKLTSNGNIDTLKWITGLHAPKGLSIYDGKLYEADVDISDMMTNRILRYTQGSDKTEVFLESAELEMPNGLYVDGNTLVVGAWGVITDPATFGTDVKGRVKLIDLDTKTITNVGDGPIANIDGIVKYGDDYIITDWVTGELMKV